MQKCSHNRNQFSHFICWFYIVVWAAKKKGREQKKCAGHSNNNDLGWIHVKFLRFNSLMNENEVFTQFYEFPVSFVGKKRPKWNIFWKWKLCNFKNSSNMLPRFGAAAILQHVSRHLWRKQSLWREVLGW